MTTLYETLGVHAHATDEEIKRAYRKAAMKWHPDRNHGAEKAAHAAFQEIKDAYAILSDPEQRKVYDAVYAEQMRHWEAQRERHQQAQTQRAAAARAADEAAYAEMVSVAIRFADEGHNRDVLFGVLLGRQCEPRRAAQIADSVAALQASRREAAKAGVARDAGPATGPASAAGAADAVGPVGGGKDADMPPPDDAVAASNAAADDAPAKRAKHPHQAKHANQDEPTADAHPADAHPAGALGGLWFQFLNSLRF